MLARVIGWLMGWDWIIALRYLVMGPPRPAPGMDEVQMRAFLYQTAGMAPGAALIGGTPASTQTRMAWRKHDMGAADGRGYMASDSAMDVRGTGVLVIQTFDFGGGDRAFGRFDANGDGGQVIQIIDGWATVLMTQDGGDGIQWFSGPDDNRLGWLLFGSDADGTWRTVTAALTKVRSADNLADHFNAAWTRYRRQSVTMPFQVGGTDDAPRVLDVIVSEHYGGPSRDAADAMERFIFAKGLGMVRWERWLNPAMARVNWTEARGLGTSGRLPPIPEMAKDAPLGWVLVDGRCWTNLCHYPDPVSVADFGWKAQEMIA